MRKRETFAVVGQSIRLRLFAGYEFSEQTLLESDLVSKAYAGGMPMGALLSGAKAFLGGVPKVGEGFIAKNHSLHFPLWATLHFNEGWLQRAQIVKGWIDAEET